MDQDQFDQDLAPTQNPRLLVISELEVHPSNPRIGGLRWDVVKAIAADLKKAAAFDPAFAIQVRPLVTGGYEIISGAHRTAAAKQAGLSEVWAWVMESADDEALMELGLANRQSDLTPLEIGLHYLSVAETKSLTQATYAKKMGIHHQAIHRYKNGAKVYLQAKSKFEFPPNVRAKAEHFAVIHALPKIKWTKFAIDCVAKKWTVAETKKRVQALKVADSGSSEPGPGAVEAWRAVAPGEAIDIVGSAPFAVNLPGRKLWITPVYNSEGMLTGVTFVKDLASAATSSPDTAPG